MKLKICGMKYPENIKDVASLHPDYIGFIFYEESKRNFDKEIPKIANKIKKTGVFVNATKDFILEKAEKYNLRAVQLHGGESPEFCKALFGNKIEVIKAFSVSDDFDFSLLTPYETVCDYFLFDTKGKDRGGNGLVFDWKILKQYTFDKPYFLSGGIGLEEVDNLKLFLGSDESKHCYAVDVNSKFEFEAGLKNTIQLKSFIQHVNF